MTQTGATNLDPIAAAILLPNATFIIYLPEACGDASRGKSYIPGDWVALIGSSGPASQAQIEMVGVE